jgi:hypothetical protein
MWCLLTGRRVNKYGSKMWEKLNFKRALARASVEPDKELKNCIY